MPFTIEMTTHGVLLAGGWRTENELSRMSAEDKRNALIVELSAHTNQPIGHFQSFHDDVLVGKGAIVVFLRQAGIRHDSALKNMSDEEQRNTLIVENSNRTGKPIPQLQGMNDQDLVKLGLEWFSGLMDGISSCCGTTERSKKRWEDQRHKSIVEHAADFLRHTAPQADVDAFNSTWKNQEFRDAVFKGLRDADYVFPYDGFVYSSHFYDPDTQQNFWGLKDPTAKTEALRHFYAALAKRSDNKPLSEIGYELGLSLHYLTDLSQPMHAANYINNPLTLNFVHAEFEKRLEDNLDEYHASPPNDRNYLDRELNTAGSIDNLVQSLAQKSKKIFLDELKPFLNPFRSNWKAVFLELLGQGSFDGAAGRALNNGEIAAAALLLSWSRRGVDALIDGVYHRFLKRAPDAGGRSTYRDFLIKKRETVRNLVYEVASSHEYYTKFVQGRDSQLWFRDFFDRERPRDLHNKDKMPIGIRNSEENWRPTVLMVTGSREFNRRFGDFGIPGPAPISNTRRREGQEKEVAASA